MVPDPRTPITSRPVQSAIFPFGKGEAWYSTKLSQKDASPIALALNLSGFAGRAPFQIWPKNKNPDGLGMQRIYFFSVSSVKEWLVPVHFRRKKVYDSVDGALITRLNSVSPCLAIVGKENRNIGEGPGIRNSREILFDCENNYIH